MTAANDPRQLFHRAAAAYRDGHQACVACGEAHCVFYSARDGTEEYRCFACGFCVGSGRRSGYVVGREQPDAIDVLNDEQPTLLEHLEDHPALRGE